MKKIIERLLIFFIGIPAVFALVYLLPYYRHLPLNVFIIIFSAIGAVEFAAMLEKKQIHISKAQAALLGSLAPLAATLTISINLPQWLFPLMIMAGALWALLSGIFTRSENLGTAANRLAGSFAVMAYPGFFMYWIVRMSSWENSSAIFLFLFISFANDSTAWLAGSLFGKNNRGLIPASPNKSIAGFIGGIIGSLIVANGALFLFPSVFGIGNIPVPGMLFIGMSLGFFTGVFASLGDLAESAIKRSCDFKDSGKVILGRGGILDSIDSIAVAAPVYFLLYTYLFNI